MALLNGSIKMTTLVILLIISEIVIQKSFNFTNSLLGKQFSHVLIDNNTLKMKTQKEDSYLRLRLRFENQELSIIHAKKVESTLLLESEINLGAGVVYEVSLDSVRLDVSSIPYDGLFVDMAANQNRYGLEQMPETFEFHVRIPLDNLRCKDLEKLNIELYRLNNRFSDVQLNDEKIIKQFPNKLELLAELNGIHLKDLPNALKVMIKEAFE